jgi:CRP-like cAMP-binding protein
MTRTFGPGQIIFREGEESTDVFFILSGRVRIRLRTAIGPCVLSELGPGEFFGEMGVIEEAPRSATAEAMEPTELEVISEAEFSRSVLQQPTRLHRFLGTLFERLRHSSALVRAQAAATRTEPEPDAASAPRFRLTIQSRYDETGYAADRVDVVVTKLPFLIGREAGPAGGAFSINDLNLTDKLPFQVSRHHCAIEQQGSRLVVRDRGSAVGTWVNGLLVGVRGTVLQANLQAGSNTLVLGEPTSPQRFTVAVTQEPA